jgi:hypothetical protein
MANIGYAISRTVCVLAGTGLSAYCAYTAFRNGMNMAENPADSYMLGAAGVAAASYGWVALTLAANARDDGKRWEALAYRFSYVLAVVFILANAIGYTAEHRTNKVGFKTTVITAYDEAWKSLQAERAELEAAKKNARWTASAGCTDATVPKTTEFCGRINILQSNIAAHQVTVNNGRPGAADAQADLLAWVTQSTPEFVSRIMPVGWAVIIEILCTFCWNGALRRAKKEAAPVITVVEPVEVVLPRPVRLALEDKRVKAVAVDLSPYWEALAEATAALALIDEARRALAAQPIIVPAPVQAPIPAPRVKEVAKLDPAKRRDNKGRFAKKAKLVAVTETPKPRLGDLPTLNGSENVVIFGSKKED